MGNVWETKIGAETQYGMPVGQLKQSLLSPYGNIVALLKETPYEAHTGTTAADEAGNRLSDALSTGTGVNKEFATALNGALADPKLRAHLVELTQKDPGKLKAEIGKIAGMRDGAQMQKTLMADLMPAPVAPAPARPPATPPAPVRTATHAPAHPTVTPPVRTATPATPPPNPATTAAAPAAPLPSPVTVASTPVAPVPPAGQDAGQAAETTEVSAADAAKVKSQQELLDLVNSHPELKEALEKATPEQKAKAMQKIGAIMEDDPDFVKKAKKLMDDHPQMVAGMAQKFVDDPDAALAQMNGLQKMDGMKSSLMQFANMISPKFGEFLGGLFDKFSPMLAGIMGNLGGLGKTLTNPSTQVVGNAQGSLVANAAQIVGALKPGQTLTVGADGSMKIATGTAPSTGNMELLRTPAVPQAPGNNG